MEIMVKQSRYQKSNMNEIVENKKYFVAPLNSSKANKFTSYYHYSGVGFKKAKLNLGVYKKDTKLLVGVLQWGCSAQEGIRLDRYVKEPITKDEYYELNRFCMADSEGKNSESQAISLGIKWIKHFHPHIKLLVSYAGRKEGNVGYIYQATNWEYLGYFISPGFWIVDGEERHQITLWYRYSRSNYTNLPFIDGLCQMYDNVTQTWTKQFIYVQRLDHNLTLASEILPYPKVTDGPIIMKIKNYKGNITTPNNLIKGAPPEYYYDKKELLFSRRKLIRDGVLDTVHDYKFARYDLYGNLVDVKMRISDYAPEFGSAGIHTSYKENKLYKNYYFQRYLKEEQPLEEIEVPVACFVDEIPFPTLAEAARYVRISRQAVSAARLRNSTQIGGKPVTWCY